MSSILACDAKEQSGRENERECDTRFIGVTPVSVQIRKIKGWSSGARLDADLCEVHVAGLVGFLESRGLKLEADV